MRRNLTSLFICASLSTLAEQALAAPPELIKPSEAALADATQAAKQIRLQPGIVARVWAAEPLLENPVSFAFDEKGRMYVAEAFRIHSAVLDNRSRGKWPSEAFRQKASKERLAQISDEILNAELGARTLADRERFVKTYFEGDLDRFTKDSDIIKRLVDVDGDGVADQSTVFAAGFNRPMDGLMAGLLARKGGLWVTNIPSLWRLSDKNDDGVSDGREEVSTGYGVRYAFMGHDMHGLRVGPDGRLYFSIGDRGASVKTKEGKLLTLPDRGGVFRSELDGSRLELVAQGLRNPQELAFDEFGNLFTGDNNSDGGDKARFAYLVEGGDYGWHVGYQYLTQPVPRGPWNVEKMWAPAFKGQPAYMMPAIENISNGPSGLTYHPGSGQLKNYRNHFFLADFRGQATSSGIHSFTLRAEGAGFRLVSPQRFAWGVLASDVDFGPDGALYLSDWLYGWDGTGKGRIHRLVDEKPETAAPGESVQSLLAGSWKNRTPEALSGFLSHPDVRVRMEAQFALVEAGRDDLLSAAAEPGKPILGQVHALWGLGQILRQAPGAKLRSPATSHALQAQLIARLNDKAGTAEEDEVKAQVAKILGETSGPGVVEALLPALSHRNARIAFFAALSLAKLQAKAAKDPAVSLLARNADRDPFLRHAAIMALAAAASDEELAALSRHSSSSVRLGATVALRRHGSAAAAVFLQDKDINVVREAARAINDLPIEEANESMAGLASASRLNRDPVVLGRVIHANFRLGTQQAAELIAKVAADRRVDAMTRHEAVTSLAEWGSPQPRNRITGSFRPLPTQSRDGKAAAVALASVLDALLARKQPEVFVVAAATAARLQLTQASPRLAQAIVQRWDNEQVRLAALMALSDLGGPELQKALPQASKDPSPKVRLWALKARVKAEPTIATSLVEEALRKGSTEEKQAAISILSNVTGELAEQKLVALMDDLLRKKLPQSLALDVLEAAKRRGGKALEAKLQAYESQRPADDLGPYIEVGQGGDAEAGRRVFMFHSQVQCRRCHSIEGHGTEVGPELQGIGRKRSAEYLLEAIVFPSKHFAPGFESVLVTMKSGSIHGGTVKRETAKLLQIDSVEEGQVALPKQDIADREPGASGMPDGFGSILTKRELRDLVAFLAASKG